MFSRAQFKRLSFLKMAKIGSIIFTNPSVQACARARHAVAKSAVSQH